jgi:hypothetical protein
MIRSGLRRGVAVSLLFSAAPAAAMAETPAAQAPLGAPTVSYRARVELVRPGGQAFHYRLYYTPERQRIEYSLRGRSIVSLVDVQARRAVILFPDRKRYRRARFRRPEFAFGIAGKTARLQRVGTETVSGVRTTKYRAVSESRQGERFAGFAWISADRIVMKLDGAVTKGPRERQLMQVVKTLDKGPIDPDLFRIPPGYRPR